MCECDKYESSVNALLNLEDGLFNKISKSVLDYAIHGELSAKFRRDLGISHGLAKSLIMSHGLDKAYAKSFKNNEIKSKETEMPLGISNPCDTLQNKENPCDIAPPTAFDEIAAYNAKITQMKWQRETLLLQIEKQHKSEKNAHRKARLKTLSGSLKAKIKSYRTITPLNQNAEFTPPFEIPNSWAWVKLGEICEIVRGGSFQKKDFQDFGVPCIHYGQIHAKYSFFVEKTLSFVSKEVALQNNKFAFKNNIILAITSENLDDVGKAVAYFGDEKCAIGGHTAILRHKQYAKYLLYYFYSDIFTQQKSKIAHGSKVIELSSVKLNDFIIPLPPLAEQRFIAEKLEKLLDLCKKLKTKP